MKVLISFVLIVSLAVSCRKNIEQEQALQLTTTVSNDALAPLPCHTTSFTTNYALQPGKVPPFRFTKTLYADSRVNTLNMLARFSPNHSAYTQLAMEWKGKFSYASNSARFKGTTTLWMYEKTASGATKKTAVGGSLSDLTFRFNADGFCYSITNNLRSDVPAVLQLTYGPQKQITLITVGAGSEDGIFHGHGYPKSYFPVVDPYGNAIAYTIPSNNYGISARLSYNYSLPRGSKTYNYQPTQYLISQEYSLCEAMQWLPQPTHQRESISAQFFPYDNSYRVVQTQMYKNHKFDIKGNLLSYTYADNVLQKTTWFCK